MTQFLTQLLLFSQTPSTVKAFVTRSHRIIVLPLFEDCAISVGIMYAFVDSSTKYDKRDMQSCSVVYEFRSYRNIYFRENFRENDLNKNINI